MLRLSVFFVAVMFTSSFALAETKLIPYCFGQSSESCQIIIEGPIEEGLTQRLKTLIEGGAKGAVIYFNSPGGSLGEGISLGRYIRKIGYDTIIGGTRGLPRLANGQFDFPERDATFRDGVCESACAYAFLGGERRSLGINSRIGFHRFSTELGNIGDDRAQALSGQLLAYLLEMDVDPRLFVIASGTASKEMYHVSEGEALDFDILTPTTVSRFFMEPYKGGIISAVRKEQSSDRLDRIKQISAFCRSGVPYLLFFAPDHNLSEANKAGMRFNSRSYFNVFSEESVSVRVNNNGAYLTIQLDRKASNALTSDDSMDLSFLYDRSKLGYYGVQLKLNDMDRAMLQSAFTHCIS